MRLELKIIGFLSRNTDKTFTINEIAKSLVEYYSFIHRIINKLIKEGLVLKTKAGKSYLCSLNLGNEKAITLIQLSEIESKDEFYGKNKELKLILDDFIKSIDTENIITIVLFGSYARGNETKESDIDILIIINKKFNIDKRVKEIYAKYGKEINTVMMTADDFKKQMDKPISKEIIKEHYVLYGAENFVKLVFVK